MDFENEREKIAMRISFYSIIVNIVLSAGKFAAGIVGHSAAMISDAIHSASDVFATLIVMAGIKFSSRASDSEHPYGHERQECVAAIILAAILAFVGLAIGYDGFVNIFQKDRTTLTVPTLLPLIAAVVSIVTKEAMYWYTRYIAVNIKSDALMADAWHHRSDAFSSIGSFVGILGARLGYPILDPITSIVISVMIIYAAYGVFKSSVDKMVDRSCDTTVTDKMRQLIAQEDGVAHIDLIHTRMFGSKIYVDVEVSASDSLTLLQSHQIAENIHEAIESNFKDVKHCMVHINPESELHHNF